MSGCDYCDEGLPKEDPVPSREPPGGWHLRVDPDGYEPTQRIPCMLERNEEQAWTMVNKISGLIEERDSLRERVAFLVAEAHGWQPRLEAAEAEVARLREALRQIATPKDHKHGDEHPSAIARAALAKEDTDE